MGMPEKAELALKVVLPRVVIERLMVRAHRGAAVNDAGSAKYSR